MSLRAQQVRTIGKPAPAAVAAAELIAELSGSSPQADVLSDASQEGGNGSRQMGATRNGNQEVDDGDSSHWPDEPVLDFEVGVYPTDYFHPLQIVLPCA